MKESALDRLLRGRSPKFIDTVRSLVQQYDIDQNDPTFILLVGTKTLEALLIEYPQQFESLFVSLLAQMNQRWDTLQSEIIAVTDSASKKLADDWHQVHAKLISTSLESAKTAHQIDSRLNEVRHLLDSETRKVEQLIKEQLNQLNQQRTQFTELRNGLNQAAEVERAKVRDEAENQANMLITLYQGQSKEIEALYAGKCKELEAHCEGQTKELEALAVKLANHATATAQANVQQHIKAFNKGIKWKYYAEAAALACATAAVLVASTWTTAWISRGRAEANSDWANIERWNAPELQACITARTPTCNFHIRSPEEKDK